MLLSVSGLPLPLSDRVLVLVAAAAVVFWMPLPFLDRVPVVVAVVFWLHLEGRTSR